MTGEFRQKLLNWFCSMLILTLGSVTLTAQIWFTSVVPSLAILENRDWDTLYPLSQSLEIYCTTFPALLLWHCTDMLSSQGNHWTIRKFLGRYRYVLALLLMQITFAGFILSRWLDDLFCPEVVFPPGTFVFDGCGSWTPKWKLWLWAFAFFGIWLFALARLIAEMIRILDPFRSSKN